MRILLTGACGFAGTTLAKTWAAGGATHRLFGVDSLVRPGSESNRLLLRRLGIDVRHGDIRVASDLESLPPADWVIDAAANPSVLAGVDGRTSSRQLVEHNLQGTINILEYCRFHRAGLILLSTSRVYSVAALSALAVEAAGDAFRPATNQSQPGLSPEGISEQFPTDAPRSLYGTTKLASEALALEYGSTFGFPVRINRCGVLAGAGQFGRADQGIFSFWIHSWARRRDLAYIGFDGTGRQVRDCLHPRDLVSLLDAQMSASSAAPAVLNVSGGMASACSLREASAWCAHRFGAHTVTSHAADRPYDVPWLVLDSRQALTHWGWRPSTTREQIFEEIAAHAEQHPDWLEVTA